MKEGLSHPDQEPPSGSRTVYPKDDVLKKGGKKTGTVRKTVSGGFQSALKRSVTSLRSFAPGIPGERVGVRGKYPEHAMRKWRHKKVGHRPPDGHLRYSALVLRDDFIIGNVYSNTSPLEQPHRSTIDQEYSERRCKNGITAEAQAARKLILRHAAT